MNLNLTLLLAPVAAVAMVSCSTVNQPVREIPAGPDPCSAASGDCQTYNADLDRLFSAMLRELKPSQMRGTIAWHGTSVRFAVIANELLQLDPSEFDDIRIIRKPEGDEHVSHPVRRGGLGLPLVMMQRYRPEKASPNKLFPLNGRHLPATLVADRDKTGTLVLRFHHTRNIQQIAFKGGVAELAYDLTTPLNRSMGGHFNGNLALPGLISSDRYLADTGIYLPDVHDPRKIPVVFVHGIKSDPHVWQNAMNEVLRDPELRKKYQCWYFFYPTGLPIYASAAKLRRMLHLARDYYDPGHDNPQMNRMVLVGHSMGGILSRMQVIDSGDDIYAAAFTKPAELLRVQETTRSLIRESMYFERVPFVKRVVFVATPHQGSSMAQIPLIRAVSLLVNPTRTLDSVTMDVRLHAKDSVHPALDKFKNLGTRSTQTLSPEHPLIGALRKRPIRVPYHSVIAAKHPESDISKTTDGIVAYWSSHIDGAASETLVSGDHGCPRLPAVSDEIRRLLHLHAR